ncbi:hypothetical protein [Actinomadura opuntiae]|uniref:hypothetical protein n=1 Tax=Actinomadura sp. OS1-43 TaxID=604315 RepID=UPI00255AF05C|nr:hypothetical protein [Actinomadura sp. OS1-43]MDL4820761.1 hypothetical protein [Actinomadura sp. OS1-43]
MPTKRRRTGHLFTLMTAIAMIGGCSHMDPDNAHHQPRAARPDTIRAQIDGYSKTIRAWANVSGGQTSAHGPLINLNVQGVKRGFSMIDTWSIFKSTDQATGEGYQRIEQRLPGNGWRITRRGTSDIQDNAPKLWAEHGSDHVFLQLEWLHPTAGHGAKLLVTVESGVYTAPADVDLDSY